MCKKYKFMLTLKSSFGNYELDSYYEMDGVTVAQYPNEISDELKYSNFDKEFTVKLKGVFDSYDEAMKAASKVKVYKVVMHYENHAEYYEDNWDVVDYFEDYEDYCDSETPYIFFTKQEAFDFGRSSLYDINHPYTITVKPEYTVEEIEIDDNEDVPEGSFKYLLYTDNNSFMSIERDSFEDSEEYFDSYEEAEAAAEEAAENYEVEEDVEAWHETLEIEILNIRVEEVDD